MPFSSIVKGGLQLRVTFERAEATGEAERRCDADRTPWTEGERIRVARAASVIVTLGGALAVPGGAIAAPASAV